MTIDELIESGFAGEHVRLAWGQHVIAATIPEPGVYVYEGWAPGDGYGPEVYLSRVDGGGPAERITATWLSRACVSFERAMAVAA